jgi:hypothetical protein
MYLFDRANDRVTLKQAGEIRMWAKIVQTNAEELKGATRRLSSEDWSLAVPKVKRVADDLYSSVEQLCTEVEQLENELTPAPPEPGSRNPWQ